MKSLKQKEPNLDLEMVLFQDREILNQNIIIEEICL